jgi:hypothetical protein
LWRWCVRWAALRDGGGVLVGLLLVMEVACSVGLHMVARVDVLGEIQLVEMARSVELHIMNMAALGAEVSVLVGLQLEVKMAYSVGLREGVKWRVRCAAVNGGGPLDGATSGGESGVLGGSVVDEDGVFGGLHLEVGAAYSWSCSFRRRCRLRWGCVCR